MNLIDLVKINHRIIVYTRFADIKSHKNAEFLYNELCQYFNDYDKKVFTDNNPNYYKPLYGSNEDFIYLYYTMPTTLAMSMCDLLLLVDETYITVMKSRYTTDQKVLTMVKEFKVLQRKDKINKIFKNEKRTTRSFD